MSKIAVLITMAVFGFSLVVAGLIVWLTIKPAPRPSLLNNNRVCIQVITRARDPKTGQERDFPTPCDVPKGWQVVSPTVIQDQKPESIETLPLTFDNPSAKLDPFNDPNGPFFHDVYQATSNDGLNFTKVDGVVVEKASVPDIIKTADGKLFIYAVDGASRSRSGLMVAISDDAGETWQQGSLQLTCQRDVCSGADPEAVVLPDGRIRLYYMVFPKIKGSPGSLVKHSVYSALSKNGLIFQEEEGVRFEYEQITDPDVVKVGDHWFMYLSQGPRLIVTRSTDGLTFKFERIIREKGSVSNTVSIGDNRWRQFFCDRGISSATTNDGLNFTNDPGSRLEPNPSQIICDPAPEKIGDEWLMYYKVAAQRKQ